MDAIDFGEAKKRMCDSYLECRQCPLVKVEDCSLGGHFTTDEINKTIVETVEAWAKAHPMKTRQSEFLKMFPNTRVNEDGIIAICPKAIDVTLDFRCNEVAYLCDDCGKRYWLEEIE